MTTAAASLLAATVSLSPVSAQSCDRGVLIESPHPENSFGFVDASADGSMVIGQYSQPGVFGFSSPFFWSAATGPVPLDVGAAERATVRSISDSGRIIVGRATLPSGETRPVRWVDRG
ncbi:MAG: hypothetical protein AAGG01_03925, partial [Planctomycetota bacterium]